MLDEDLGPPKAITDVKEKDVDDVVIQNQPVGEMRDVIMMFSPSIRWWVFVSRRPVLHQIRTQR